MIGRYLGSPPPQIHYECTRSLGLILIEHPAHVDLQCKIKCLLMAGFFEMELLAKLGTSFGIIAGMKQNLGKEKSVEEAKILGLGASIEYRPTSPQERGDNGMCSQQDCSKFESLVEKSDPSVPRLSQGDSV